MGAWPKPFAGVTVEPAPYLPFAETGGGDDLGDFRWRLGLRPLDLEAWFDAGPDVDTAVAAKRPLMERFPDTVFVALDDTVVGEATEVATAVLDHVRQRSPDARLDPGRHPLEAAALLVADDLVLLVERDGQLVVGTGSVCFPNRWDLRSKLGSTLAEVHGPVPRLNEQLEKPIDAFFDRLTPARSFWRLGWGLIDRPDWYAPLDGTAPARPVPGRAHLRVERETIRRFPQTGCVLFTIRTHVTPIDAVVGDPEVARRLARAVAAWPYDVAHYKGLAAVADDLRRHVGAQLDERRRAASVPDPPARVEPVENS